ncbi:RIP metalloprotease RseP [bacterium]|nr:RIP metalloprotease RseP [bacterium]
MPSNLLITIFAFVLTLGLVVIVHELGHFLFCKLFGVYVKTFSIGIGPKLVRQRWGETEYVLSAIPFGGYVKMAGEGLMEEIQDTGTWEERKYPMGTEQGNAEAAGMDDHIPPERHFHTRPAWQRFLVFVAGPLFNLVLAFVIYTLLILGNGLQTIPFTRLGEVTAGSPAAEAGLQVGDRLLMVDGQPVEIWSEVINGLVPEANVAAGQTPPVRVVYERDGMQGETTVAPRFDPERNVWDLGLSPWNTTVGLVQKGGPAADLGLRQGDVILRVAGQAVTSFGAIADRINDRPDEEVLVEWERGGQPMSGTVVPELTEIAPGEFKGRIFLEPFFGYQKVGLGEAMSLGYERTMGTIRITAGVLQNFVRRELGLDAVGGPLRIGQAAGEMLRWSFSHLMYFVAFFSINLFLLNLMPIPVLDGGHVLFLFIEVLRGGRPVPERLQAIATQVGLIILLLFMTFVVVLDVWKVTGH